MRWRRRPRPAPAVGPDASTRAMVAAATGAPDADELIAQARREAAANGTAELFEATLASMTAERTAGPDARTPEAEELDRLIRRAALRSWLPDDTVQAAIQRATGPAEPGRMAEKYARQAAVLRRLGEPAALRAAQLAVRAAGPDTDDGHLAYAAWFCSGAAASAGDPEGAYAMGAIAAQAFRRGMPLRPECVPDAVDALMIQGRAAAELGRYDESERIGIEALTLFRRHRPYPDGPTGAMPAGWGLPMLDPERVAALQAWSDQTTI